MGCEGWNALLDYLSDLQLHLKSRFVSEWVFERLMAIAVYGIYPMIYRYRPIESIMNLAGIA